MRGRNGKWSTPAVVKLRREHNRSYVVESEEGGMFLRNQRYLKPRLTNVDLEGSRLTNPRDMSPDSMRSPAAGSDSAEQAAGPAGQASVTGGPAFRTRSRTQARSA